MSPVCSEEVVTLKQKQSGGEIISTVCPKESCNHDQQSQLVLVTHSRNQHVSANGALKSPLKH